MISNSLLTQITNGRDGSNWGYSMGLKKLEAIVDGVCKQTYTLLFAGSGCGKSNLMMYAYIYRPLMEHLDDDNFFVYLFSLEMKAEIILAKLLCIYIFEKYHIEISFKELLSKKRNYKLPDEYYRIVLECMPWLKKVESKLKIFDKGANADTIYAKLKEDLEEKGKFEEQGTRKIYYPNNPNLTYLVVVDHMGLLRTKAGRTKKQEIDLLSNYFVYLRNTCGISPLAIMQSNRDQTSSARRQLGMYLPQMSDVKETNVPYEDSDITLAIYNPNSDKRKTHNDYDIVQFGDTFRSIVCIKNRYGESNVEDNCAFYGKSNIWVELPKAQEIFDVERYKTPDWLWKKQEMPDNNSVLDENTNNKSFKFNL
jgi:hypothetical protein